MERSGVSCAVFDCDAARIRACAGVPPGRRPGGSDRAVAPRRRGICGSAATSWRHALEHCSRTAGQCSPRANPPYSAEFDPVSGMGAYAAGCLFINPVNLDHRCGSVGFQHSSRLPSRWRPDSSVAALVRDGAGAKFIGGDDFRLRWRRGIYWARHLYTIRLEWCDRRLPAHELLERVAARSSFVTFRKAATPGWICLPKLQNGTASRRFLAVRAMPEALRHVLNPGRVSTLRGPLQHDEVSRLRGDESHRRLDGSQFYTNERVTTHA